MKRIALALTLALAFGLVYGQSNKVVSAWNYMKPEYNELDKAKVAIDLATVHPKTQAQPKTWYYRGLVYHKLFQTKEEKFKDLDPNPLKQAEDAYIRAKELDTKKRYEKDILFKLTVVGTEFFNKGSMEYETKKFKESLESFETVLRIGSLPYINQVDTGAFFNAAIAADQAGMYDKALQYYAKAIEFGYMGSDTYHYVAEVYMAKGDTAKALEMYQEGVAAYPEDCVFLYIQLINYHLQQRELDKAAEYVPKALEIDPNNFSLWNVYGSAYEDIDIEESVKAYKKAIEINPEFFDPYYNIGTIYFNRGVEANNKAMDIPISDEEGYNKAIAERDDLFKEALPFYEKAHELDPTFGSVLTALKEIYYRFQMNDKLEDINKKIDDLK